MRKQEISFLNTVLCLLVMFIHICSPAVVGLQKESMQFACIFLSWRASAFVVQGFLFLSALKFFRGMQKEFDYSRFLWGRAKKIGIPYVIATVLSYFGLIYLGYYLFDLKFLLKSLVLGNMISPFYFIIILFQFYLLMPLWKKMVEKVDFWVMAILSIPEEVEQEMARYSKEVKAIDQKMLDLNDLVNRYNEKKEDNK